MKIQTNLLRSWIIRAFVLCLLPACTTSYGARNVAPSGYTYNNAIAQTKDEQLLLNLVRLRYRDTVVFMDITGVTTQHHYSTGALAEAALPFKRWASGLGTLSPSAAYSETPTVNYAPLKGADFAEKLLSPISPETIILLANSGWSVERLLNCCVERLGRLSNAPSASGPTPDQLPDNSGFREMTRLLREIQREERVYVERLPSDTREGSQIYLVVDSQPGEQCQRLRELLDASNCKQKFRLSGYHGGQENGEVFAQTRTVLGALYTLSHAVSVPPDHAEDGLVTVSKTVSDQTKSWDDFLSGAFKVSASARKPSYAFVKIQYRDHWYWIDDRDLESKTTFSLMTFLLALQSAESDGRSPLLTISAGG